MFAAAILAAGESRRMGSPKALLDYRGQTFVDHLCQIVQHPRIGILRVVLGAKAEEIRRGIRVDPAMIVLNEEWESGQLSSIHAAIRNLPPGTEGLILCPVDHPLIAPKTITQLIATLEAGGKTIALPTYNGRRGHPVIFRASLYDALLAASPELGARQVVWSNANAVAEVTVEDEGVVLNLDDPETYRRAVEKSQEK